MARRKAKMEGSFADAANNHGFKRARWRGLERVGIQNLLIATVQNLRKLLRATFGKRGKSTSRSLLSSAAASFSSLGLSAPPDPLRILPERARRSQFFAVPRRYPRPHRDPRGHS